MISREDAKFKRLFVSSLWVANVHLTAWTGYEKDEGGRMSGKHVHLYKPPRSPTITVDMA